MSRLPLLYLIGAVGAFASLVAIGLVPTPLEKLAISGKAAAILRALLAFPLPLVLALYLGFSWRSMTFWIIVLLSGALMIPNTPFIVYALVAVVQYLLLMHMLPSEAVEQKEVSSRAMLGWIIGIAGFTFFLRLLVMDEPFERDLMVYSMVASSWLEGMSLYSGAWDHKPPGLYVIYAAAMAVFGQTPNAILALGFGAFVVTMLGIKSVAERLAGRRAAVVAMLIWAVFGNDVILQAQQPNAEVFMNACLIWALALLLPVAGTDGKHLNILAAGVLVFAASSIKQIVLFPAMLMALWLVWLNLANKTGGMGRRLLSAARSVVLLALPGIMGWILIFVAFQMSGNFDEFLYGAFDYNQSYAGSVVMNFVEMAFKGAVHPYYVFMFFFLLLLSGTLGDLRISLLMVAVYVGGAIMVAAPGADYPHYYQLILPALAVGCGAHIARLIPSGKVIGTVLIVLAPIWISFGYFTSSERLAFVKYGKGLHGGASLDSRELGRWLARNTSPEDTIFHWGAEPGVYFWTGRPTKYRFSFNYPLFAGPRAREFSDEVLRDVSCNPPDIVAISKGMIGDDHPVSVFLAENYTEMSSAPAFDFFEVWTPTGNQPECR